MRRSEWRRRADDPKGPLGWWWRGVVERDRMFWVKVGLTLGLAAMMLMDQKAFTAILLIPVLFVSAGLELRRARRRLRALLSDPAPEGQFLASVAYRRGGVTTGRDEMALCMVDGWLVAEGVRSSFALRTSDVLRPEASMDGGEPSLRLVDGSEIFVSDLNAREKESFRAWLRDRRPIGGGAVFPPARAHPQEIARWWAWIVASVAVAGAGGILVALFVPKGPVHLGALLAAWGIGGGTAKWAFAMLDRLRQIVGQAPPLQRDVECGASAPLSSGASAPRVPPAVDDRAELRR